jgi:hypothetical protein
MRAFQPIARRMEAERARNRWTPPPILRKVAWCILGVSLAYEIIAGSRLLLYLIKVQENPGYALTHMWQGSPLLVLAPIAMLLCIPFVAQRGPRQKKKHIPDPELSIRPR